MRQYYSQVQALYDPTVFLLPVLLYGNVILPKTLEAERKYLDWEEPLPKAIIEEIVGGG